MSRIFFQTLIVIFMALLKSGFLEFLKKIIFREFLHELSRKSPKNISKSCLLILALLCFELSINLGQFEKKVKNTKNQENQNNLLKILKRTQKVQNLHILFKFSRNNFVAGLKRAPTRVQYWFIQENGITEKLFPYPIFFS